MFSLHAKTLVVDSRIAYIGTFNFDPRSESLNIEVGVIVHDEAQPRSVEAAVETDMVPGNGWNARQDNPGLFASVGKRTRVRFYQFLPLKPLL